MKSPETFFLPGHQTKEHYQKSSKVEKSQCYITAQGHMKNATEIET